MHWVLHLHLQRNKRKPLLVANSHNFLLYTSCPETHFWCWVWAVLCQWEQGHFVQPRPLCCPHPARLRRCHCSWSMSPAACWKSSPDSEQKSLKITGKRKIPSHNSGQLSVTPMEMLSLEVAMPCMSSCGQDASAAITRLGLKAANRSHLIIIYSVTL